MLDVHGLSLKGSCALVSFVSYSYTRTQSSNVQVVPEIHGDERIDT
jgi:hypothetical protein